MYTENRASGLKFVEYGNSQIETSRILTEKKKYKEAIFFFLQASENTTKALGYFCLNINPRQVGHTAIGISKHSINGFMLEIERLKNYFENIIENLNNKIKLEPESLDAIINSLLNLLPNLLTQAFNDVIPKAKLAIVSIESLETQKDIDHMRDMWLKTLYINDNDSKLALKKALNFSIEYNTYSFDSIYTNVSFVGSFPDISKLPQIEAIREYAKEISYTLKSTVLALDLFGFNYLGYMHQQPTRYPKINSKDYWDNDAYTEDKELVKNLPDLITQLEALNKEVYKLINEYK